MFTAKDLQQVIDESEAGLVKFLGENKNDNSI
jgi:hypothetical protein